jgi:hypothetical protein
MVQFLLPPLLGVLSFLVINVGGFLVMARSGDRPIPRNRDESYSRPDLARRSRAHPSRSRKK